MESVDEGFAASIANGKFSKSGRFHSSLAAPFRCRYSSSLNPRVEEHLTLLNLRHTFVEILFFFSFSFLGENYTKFLPGKESVASKIGKQGWASLSDGTVVSPGRKRRVIYNESRQRRGKPVLAQT